MAKKKKTALKPVARGFATTSVPKKVALEPAQEPEEPTTSAAPQDTTSPQGQDLQSNDVPIPPLQLEEFDPDKVEDQSLQNLIDKFQDKTEREITRTVKAIEQDRRFTKTLPSLEIDPAYVDYILELASGSEFDDAKRSVDGPEEKVVTRLAITYGVLRRLGFSEAKVEECLKAIRGIELDEAYDWLYMHCEEEALVREKDISDADPRSPPKTPRTPRTPRTPARIPFTPRTPSRFLVPPTPTPPQILGRNPLGTKKAGSLLSPMATSFVPSGQWSPSISLSFLPPAESGFPSSASFESLPGTPPLPDRTQEEDDGSIPSPSDVHTRASSAISANSETSDAPVVDDRAAMKARILATYGGQAVESAMSTSSTTSDRESPVSDDPHAEYVRVKMELDSLTTYRQRNETRGDEFVRELSTKLSEVKQHYFFNEREAEAMYAEERNKADAAALRDRLRGTSATEEAEHLKMRTAGLPRENLKSPLKHRPPNLLQTPTATLLPDIFAENDEEGGGFLELLQDIPEETTDAGVTVEVRNMALPKHFSGRTPKLLLSETVAKVDRYAAITYSCISGGSRAVRASVSVRGDVVKSGDWTMKDVACHDQGQAEQFIATVALHALSFPSSEGFALGSTAATTAQTSFRVLPPIYRDLWDELEARRKASDDATNRAVWAKLRSIVEPKLESGIRSADKSGKADLAGHSSTARRFGGSTAELSAEQIKTGFEARHASPAYQAMLAQRSQLPIAQYRQEIMQTLRDSQVLVLSGETGCGKSTQVPSFILEDQLSQGKHCKIYCTEPRRISAISLAQRVSAELGDPPGAVGTNGSLIGYSIRLESNTSKTTRLTFVTNGIALRMLEGGSGEGGQGTAFDEITHIVIDEVHERSIESDFLLIVLKSLLQQRDDLKVILMSATVDAEKISDYFGGCPILRVPGRTFPVDIRYLEDAVEFTGWSITENSPYARRLHDKFYKAKNRPDWSEDTAAGNDDEDEDDPVQQNVKLEKRYSAKTTATINTLDERLIPYDLIVRLMERVCFDDSEYTAYSGAILIFMPGLGEIRRMNDLLAEHRRFGGNEFVIHPLHSTISSENQGAVFNIPPAGIRKIVIATNIAETGITIPDITCVIDTGKHREMRFDEKRQISHLIETFIAKSNAAQRRGRAGRVQNGLCFHLFTKLRHDTMMSDHPLPEMMRLSLSDLALRIKIMNVKLGTSIEDVLTRALDPPSPINIQRAVSALVEVRALTPAEEITPMGRLLSKLPTDVHLGKFLLVAAIFRCLDPALTIAAALNSKSPFLTPFGHEDVADAKKNSFRIENSDFLTLHNVYASWRRASATNGSPHKFCRLNYLSHQNLQQIEELRQQFLGYLADSSFIPVSKSFIKELSRARYSRNRTRFVTVPSELDANSGNVHILNAALAAGLYPKMLSIEPKTGQLRTITNEKSAAFHPSSVNFGRKPTDFGVHYLSYFTLMQSKKLYAWETGPADDLALLLLCGDPDFKLISDCVFVDRKVRFSVAPKTNIALKHLRHQLNELIAMRLRGQPLKETQILWNELAETVLGKVKENGDAGDIAAAVVVNKTH